MVLSSWRFLLLLGSSCTWPAMGVGQEVTADRSLVRIIAKRVLVLPDSMGPSKSGMPPLLFSDSKGRIYVGRSEKPHVTVFDAKGKYRASFGREGGGPGEYSPIITGMAGRGDTIHIFEWIMRRHTVLSGASHRFMRAGEWPMSQFPPVMLPSGRFMMLTEDSLSGAAHRPRPQALGVVDGLTGKLSRVFGYESSGERDRSRSVPLCASLDGTVWSPFALAYRLEEWDERGHRRRLLTRSPEWFHPRDVADPGSIGASFASCEVDRAGRIWILVHVPREGITRVAPRLESDLRTRSEGMVDSRVRSDSLFDSVVEVIDPVRNRLIASHRFRQFFWRFVGGGRVVSTPEDANGEVAIEVWRLALDATGAE
jgi:hypothetical protein